MVLPSHNECFHGLHARLQRLRSSQTRSLDGLREALAAPKRAVDVFGALFARGIGESDLAQMSLATGESIACLTYLMYRGEVCREMRDDGTLWYSLTGAHRGAHRAGDAL